MNKAILATGQYANMEISMMDIVSCFKNLSYVCNMDKWPEHKAIISSKSTSCSYKRRRHLEGGGKQDLKGTCAMPYKYGATPDRARTVWYVYLFVANRERQGERVYEHFVCFKINEEEYSMLFLGLRPQFLLDR